MSILSIQRCDADPNIPPYERGMFEDIKPKDHFVFSLNMDGDHPDVGVGYSVVNTVIDNFAHDFKSIGENDLGTVVSVESHEHRCWFHGIVNHSIADGWYDGNPAFGEPNCYLAMENALNHIWEEHEGEIVRPIKSLWLSRGKMRQIGQVKGNLVKATGAMANTEAELVVYVLDE